MKYADVTLGRVEAVWNKLGGEEGVDKLLRGELTFSEPEKPKPGTNVFTVTVDFGQTLEEMIAAGRYDWKNDDITTKRFPVKGEGKKEVEITVVHFNRVIESDEAIKEMDALGYRPATIEELLGFGKEHPDLQRSFPIIALGSVGEVRGHRGVPYLRGRGSRRNLDLRWFDHGWSADCRFAFVRK